MKTFYVVFACLGLIACSESAYTGRVDGIHPTRSSVLIDLAGHYPDQKMALYVPKETCLLIHGHWPTIGTTVRVKGDVTTYRGRPEIIINDPSQLTW